MICYEKEEDEGKNHMYNKGGCEACQTGVEADKIFLVELNPCWSHDSRMGVKVGQELQIPTHLQMHEGEKGRTTLDGNFCKEKSS
jgi:hypothetical protein